jgi:hypothetical protein
MLPSVNIAHEVGLQNIVDSVQYLTIILQAQNIFDNLPALAAPKAAELHDKLVQYLSTDPEQVKDVLLWWNERKLMYPCLSCMALNYLMIPSE